MEYTADLKSAAERLEGSNPSSPTMFSFFSGMRTGWMVEMLGDGTGSRVMETT